ncbi:hypothetical protein [Ornithinimicrobium kibberense]|uniref:hypothetical protein n=1 Tax=Ornithinimicrobium kibberense TaxID=282060 RepID=UPI003606D7E8
MARTTATGMPVVHANALGHRVRTAPSLASTDWMGSAERDARGRVVTLTQRHRRDERDRVAA